jgi:hypothetical protein
MRNFTRCWHDRKTKTQGAFLLAIASIPGLEPQVLTQAFQGEAPSGDASVYERRGVLFFKRQDVMEKYSSSDVGFGTHDQSRTSDRADKAKHLLLFQKQCCDCATY